jgi:hypothetical protein
MTPHAVAQAGKVKRESARRINNHLSLFKRPIFFTLKRRSDIYESRNGRE